jgi:hypothetical protein
MHYYSSVADIYRANEEVRARLIARVEALDEETQNFRAGEQAWTVAEIVEHLATLEHRLSQLAAMMVGKAESVAAAAAGGDAATGGGDGAAGGAPHFKPFSLEEQVEQARTQKFVAPDEVRPRGGLSVADSLARLRKSRAAFEALRPRVERVDLSAATYPHPAFGPLNLYQWLAFIGIHEQRHLDQIERLLASRG